MSFLTDVIAGPGVMEGTYTVTRRATGTTDGRGRVVAGAASTFPMDASIQPELNGRVLEALADASHGREVRLVLTEATIDPITPAHEADLVTISGETWEVISAEHWNDFGTPFTRAHIARVTTP